MKSPFVSDRPSPAPSRSHIHILVSVALVAAVAGAAAIVLVLHRSKPVTSVTPPASAGLAQFMGLTPLGGRPAPDITLTDQRGQQVSLSALENEGKAVVLAFMDPHCIDICPIIAQEFRQAYQDLGADASRVAFVAVDVNPFHMALSDVARFSSEQGLSQIPNWHYLTGPLPALQQAWKDYGIAVQAPSPMTDVVHSDDVYFIDSAGKEEWVALPTDLYTAKGAAYLPAPQVSRWGTGIAGVSRQLLYS